LLAFELAMAKARGVVDTEVTRDYLARAGLLTEGEWEALVDGDRHTTVFWWLIVRLRQLRDAGMLNRQDFPMLVDAVGQMRGQANDLMSSLDRDNPYPYVQLIGLLVKVNLFIFASWKGFALAVFAFQFGGFGAMFGHGIVWYNLVFTLLWNASYAALYDLGCVLHNPFGQRRLDVAHETIGGGIRKLSFAIAIAPTVHLPPAIAKHETHQDSSRELTAAGFSAASAADGDVVNGHPGIAGGDSASEKLLRSVKSSRGDAQGYDRV